MKDIIDKLSSYNIFNYLLPGILFVIILPEVSSFHLMQKDLIVSVFFYYFIGLTISRIGSLIIEPTLKKLKILKFADYSKFVKASQKDSKIDLLSEVNNMYRTISSMLFVLILSKFYEFIESRVSFLEDYGNYILVILISVLYVYSYKKQTDYITKRVDINS
jgi:hypothetical protein